MELVSNTLFKVSNTLFKKVKIFFLENMHIPVFCGEEHEKRVILAIWGRKKVEISDLKHVFSWVFRGFSLSRTLFSASNGSNDLIEDTFPSKPGVENTNLLFPERFGALFEKVIF